jgi:DUF4097 and DUF4098 domain-containing protein YvlB
MQWTFATLTPPDLEVRFASGEIRIEADATDSTAIDLESRRHDEDRWRVELVERDGRPLVRIHAPNGSRPRSSEATIHISCPTGSGLDLQTGSADVQTEGVLGQVRIQAASGDVRLDRASGRVRIDTASGDVEVGTAADSLQVRTASGEITAQAALGDVKVQSASGDIEIHEAKANVEGQSASGDQSIASLGAGTARLETISGDLIVGVVPGIDVWMDLQTVSGDTQSDLAPSTGPEGDRPRLDLRMRSVSGDLKVERAPAPPSEA